MAGETIYADLVEGDTVQLTPQGYFINRKEIISKVSGTSYQKIGLAITASGHYLGQQHPLYTNSYVQNIDGTAISTDTIALSIAYEPMTNLPVEISISNRVASVQTNKDYNNENIYVTYTYPTSYTIDPDKIGRTETTGKTVDKQVPTSTITYKKREVISGDDLILRQKYYVGYMNSNTMFFDAPKTWFLTGIDSNFAGYIYQTGTLKFVYDVSYVFEKSYGGWDTAVVFVDPQTGDPPPPDTWTEETNKKIQLYGTVDFSYLL